MLSPERIRRVSGNTLRQAVLLRTGDSIVGAHCAGLAKDRTGWSVQAHDLARTGAAKWSAPLASPCLHVVVHEAAGYVATCEQETLRFWDLATGAPRFKEMPGYHAQHGLPGGRLLSLEDVPAVTADGVHHDEGTRACILDVERGVVASHFGLQDQVKRVSVDDSGARLLACGRRTILWDVARKQPLLGFDDDAARPDLAFLPGGTTIVSPYDARMSGPALLDVRVDVQRIEITRIADPRAKQRAPLLSFGVSPDGRWLATAHADHLDNHHIEGNCICVWDLTTKALVADVAVQGETSPQVYAFRASSVLGVNESWNDRELFNVSW